MHVNFDNTLFNQSKNKFPEKQYIWTSKVLEGKRWYDDNIHTVHPKIGQNINLGEPDSISKFNYKFLWIPRISTCLLYVNVYRWTVLILSFVWCIIVLTGNNQLLKCYKLSYKKRFRLVTVVVVQTSHVCVGEKYVCCLWKQWFFVKIYFGLWFDSNESYPEHTALL